MPTIIYESCALAFLQERTRHELNPTYTLLHSSENVQGAGGAGGGGGFYGYGGGGGYTSHVISGGGSSGSGDSGMRGGDSGVFQGVSGVGVGSPGIRAVEGEGGAFVHTPGSKACLKS